MQNQYYPYVLDMKELGSFMRYNLLVYSELWVHAIRLELMCKDSKLEIESEFIGCIELVEIVNFA